MKKYYYLCLFLLLTLLISGGAALADTSGAQYKTTVIISNNGTSNVSIAVPFTLNTSSMVAGGMLNPLANDCSILTSDGTPVAFMPGNTTWMTYVPSIGSGSQVNQYLYTGNVTGGKLAMFLNPSMTIADNTDDSMEIGDNGTATYHGWVNVVDGDIFKKSGALSCNVSSTGNVSLGIVIAGTPTTLNLIPNGAGDYTNITTASPVVAHYLNVDDPPASPDDGATYVSTVSVAQQKDAYNLEYSATLTDAYSINSVVVYFRHAGTGANAKAQPFLVLGGVETTGTEIACTGGGTWVTSHETLTRPGGGSWTAADIGSLQVAVGIRDADANIVYLTQVYVVVGYTPPTWKSVSVPVSGGEKTITATLDTTNLILNVNGTSNSTALGADLVPDNANLWVIGSAATPYILDFAVSVNSTQTCYIDWSYGATFTDDSLHGNFATPTFRTTSSDADVSASISAQEAVNKNTGPGGVTAGGWNMNTGNTSQPVNLFHEGGTNFPGGKLIQEVEDKNRLPHGTLMMPFAIGLSFFLGILAFAYTSNKKQGVRGSLLIAIFVTIFVQAVFCFAGGGVVPGWIMIVTGIIGAALLMFKNPFSALG